MGRDEVACPVVLRPSVMGRVKSTDIPRPYVLFALTRSYVITRAAVYNLTGRT